MDRIHRKDLKKDEFAQGIARTFGFLSEHTADVKKYGMIAVAVVVIALGVYWYMSHQTTVRGDALAQALKIDDATVGATPVATNLNFPTADEKNKARNKALTEVAAKYHGTAEGAYAQIYLGADSADRGDLADAERRFRDVVDSAPAAYAAIARLSLAETLAAQGKQADAEKVLRDAVAKPTATVSKEQATIALALLIGKRDPAEARKMLDPLKTERSGISRVAVQALGELSNPR